MEHAEKLIKEKRLMLATTKNYIGASGKFGTILKFMGDPILEQDAPDVSYLPDFYDLEEDTAILESDDEVYQIGWQFLGYDRGMDLVIKYLDENDTLTVYYKGDLVYKEVAGDLQAFVPNDEWEKLIERLYKPAAVKKQEHIKQQTEVKIEKAKKYKASFLEKLFTMWGVR